MFAKGDVGIKLIAKSLGERGIVNRAGKPFASSSISTILGNEFYTGTYHWGKKRGVDAVRIENNHPAIIDYALFERVQYITENRGKDYPARAKSKFLLTGILYDFNGHRMKGVFLKQGEKKVGYYACPIYHEGGPNRGLRYCKQRKIEADTVDAAVLERVHEIIKKLQPQIEDAIIRGARSEKSLEEERVSVQGELDALDAKMTRLMDAYLDGNTDKESFKKRNEKLKGQHTILLKKLESIKRQQRFHAGGNAVDVETVRMILDNFDAINKLDFFDRKSIIHQIVESVRVRMWKDGELVIEDIKLKEAFSTYS
jgi:site-specific DNA recombinase